MSGSNWNFGENMRKGFQALEEAVDKLKSGATKTEADAEMKKAEDRETRDFLVAELIAAREENAGLVKRSWKVEKVEAEVVPSGDDPQVGGKLPVNIFPIEVWGLMFNNLTASSDLAACSNASPDFRNELKPKRTRFLFEQVLPILINNGTFSPENVFERLLELRTICRSWKAGVDNFLENHPCHQHSMLSDYCTRASNIYSSPSELTDCLQLQHFTGFSSTEEITRCLTVLDELPLHAPKPAFIGRTIVFTEGSWTNQNILEFWAAAQRLLGMDGIGGSIWHCSILDMSPSMLHPHLPLLLQLMPNLKILKLLLKCAGRRVQAVQNSSSLPELAALQVLRVRCCKPCLPRGYQLVSCYPHVKKLELDFYKGERIEYSIMNEPRRIGTHGVISPADRE
ncbi:hypothetical protein Ocin01_18097 [Orchesella cincta]|uniref:Uncharacterized protein n=1 Tax=Orchesella cincta TaxID=48709 RepID=A0A1D2M6N4_ORCCI|nr:hypothetical protein Ocin01_18097 [Orchesella cincta]